MGMPKCGMDGSWMDGPGDVYGYDIDRIQQFMFQALVQRLLGKILGEYIQNFSAENLKIGIWSGEVVLSNLVLKKSVIRKLNLPLRVLYSRLGTLRMTIPWKSLASSKIDVVLEGLELVVAELPPSEWECRDSRIIQKRKLQVQAVAESLLSGWASRAQKEGAKEKEKGEDGYFSKLVVKIIDNLQVTVRDIHIRYEDTLSSTFAFGVTLEELKLYTVNSKGDPEYVDRSRPENAEEPLRKRLEMYNVGVYWNEKAELFKEDNYQTKMGSTIARRGKPLAHNYLILMTSQARLLQRQPGKQWEQAEIDLQVALEDIRMEVTNSQLQQIVALAERLQAYSRKLRDANRAKLSPQEADDNRKAFAQLFPAYYDGWGKAMSPEDMGKLQNILEKMEVEELSGGIQAFLQEKERERIIKQRKQKSKGWWFGKPKELTQNELTEIEAYLDNNFSQEHQVVKRAEEYYYVRVGLSMKRLEVGIANTLAIIKEGIEARMEDLGLQFCLREGGYGLDVSLENISVDMFRQVGVEPRERKPVLYKLHERTSQLESAYLKMAVTGNPLDKRHLNTDIKLTTSELMLRFDPKIITIATEFADLKLSSEYKEAAIEKFGEIKEATTSAVSESMQKPSKLKIGVDVAISSMTVVLPFSPNKQEGDCWGVNLGSIRLTSDEETLLRTEAVEGLPQDVFHLELAAFSFRHYSSPEELTHMLVTGTPYSRPAHALLDQLDFRLRLEVFSSATDTQPRLSLVTTLPAINVNLNEFTYSSVLRLEEAFAMEPKEHELRQTVRIQEKKEIQRRSVKIGFVYIKGRLTMLWEKYVAIMSENYIYLYLNKNDKDYYAYYYIKGAKLQRFSDPLDTQKPFLFRITNKVNEVVFGFDKEDQIDDWVVKINALNKEQQANVAASPPSSPVVVMPKRHNQLNLQVAAQIQSISVKVFIKESVTDGVISLEFSSLSAKMMLHESKKHIQLQLLSMSLNDSLQSYRSSALSHFIQTLHGQQQSLIAIRVQQLNKDHPDFDHTDSAIHVSFGTLLCNYKCETVQALMGFFVPSSPPSQEEAESPHSNSAEIDISNNISIQSIASGEENYSLKLFLEMKEISVTLVNSKTKTVLGRLGIADLKLYMGMSQKRMVLQGSQRDLYYIDTTNHPYTITEEQESYEQYQKYILTANIGSEKNMLQFNIQLLKTPNEYGKMLLVDVRLANLTTYFSLQPVLRLITYLTSQILPSFQAQSKQPKEIPPKDGKPEPTTMDLKVQLSNISVFVQTARELQRQRQEYMQLNIAAITVANQAAYRDYVRGNKPIILVETYQVNLYALSIAVHYFDEQGAEHRYKLTNNMDISLSTDLIANPEYYKKELPEDFDNGIRVRCAMTPFFMSINHHDYSFIMKCLNWAVTYNDGLDALLFDSPPNAPPPSDPQQKQQKDPFYLTLAMECISLFVTQQDIPIAFLEQTNLAVDFSIKNEGMVTKMTMGQLYGTSIEHDRQTGKLRERGIFNSLGYTAEHSVEDVRDLQSYMKAFDRRSEMGTDGKFLQFALTMDEQAMSIDINMSEICVDVDVRLLLVLSTLANTEEGYIKGPTPPRLPSLEQKEQEQPADKPSPPPSPSPSPPKRMRLLFNLGKFVSCVSDSSKSKFVFIQGAVSFSMINQGEKSIQQLEELRGEESLPHSTMGATLKGLTLYFSRIKNGKTVSRRQFLQPMTVNFDQRRFYHMQKEIHMLQTDIRLKTTDLMLTASLRDMLNINAILQDSLKTMADFNKDQAETKTKIEQSQRQTTVTEVDEMALQRELEKIEEKMVKQIQTKMKIIGSVGAMNFEVVNDCGRNFMPMLRMMVEESEPAMQQVLLTTEVILVPIFTLEFFNPRSSRWEPIVEPFKAALGLTIITLNKSQSTSITLKTGSLDEETSSLKVNLSTQLLSTLMAAKEALTAQQASLKGKEDDDEGADIEVSPFIFHNITNENIYILREKQEFLLPPLFKGPVRLPNDREVHFRLRQHVMKLSTDHYGVMRLADSGFFIKFDSQRLNKVIKFMPQLVIRNRLRQAVTIRRWGREESTIKAEKGDSVPLDGVEGFAVSINGNSFTERLPIGSAKLVGFMMAEKKNFLVLLRYKQRAGRFAVLELLPPFVVYNCLPKQLNLQFLQKAKLKSTVAVPAQQAYSIFTAEDVRSLEVKATTAGFTWSKKFKFVPDLEGEGQLELGDEDNFRTVLTYRFQREGSGQYRLTVYCRKFIVNELSDKLLVYGNGETEEKEGKKDQFSLVGGQRHQLDSFDEKIILLGEEIGNKLRVCGAHSHVDFATPIAVGGLGSSQARIVVDRQRGGQRKSLFSVIGVEISAVRMSKHCEVFSKKIVLRSKAIFINSTARNISIREEAATASIFRSQAGSRKSLVFGLPEIDGQQPTYTLSSEGLKPSRALFLPTQGTVHFKLKGESELTHDTYFRIIVKEVGCYSFYELTEITPQDFPYEVIVKSNSLRARIPALKQIIFRGEECRFIGEQFGSDEPGAQLQLWVGHCDSEEEVRVVVSPDDLKFKQKHLMRISRGGLEGSLAVKVEVTVRDKQRAIVIDEQTRMEEPKELQEGAISLELAEIVLSISQNSEAVEVPYESLVITLRRLQLIKLQTDKRVQYQAKLGFLQVDQAYPHVIASPVVLTPHRFAEYTREVDPKAVFNFTVVLSKEFVRNTFISQISVDLGDLVATFSADFLALATTISSQFAEVANYHQESYLVERKEEEWQGIAVPPQGKAVFVRCIRIAPFVVDLSAELNLKKLNLQNNVLLTTVLSTIGVVVSNIDSAPISMTGIEIDDCIDSMDSITRRLIAHYKTTCVSQFYKVVGSLNIIGNPLSLFRNISTGVKDLKDKPAKGFVNGPAEFGLGIVEGTTSLVAHSVGGAFNSIAKVTGTVSSGLATLAFDREFQEHREKERMKKPQNVIQGVAKGGKAIFYGFKEGITGVFLQPLENARREGAIGFFKGAGKGLAGLVVKPVTGIIDFASKTTQGIKNNALMFQDRARDERMRHPRVFYSECFILKEYSPRDSQLFAILKKVDNQQKCANPVFVDAFQSDKEKHFLILLLSGVAYLDGEGRKLKWAIGYSELELENTGKKLVFKKAGKTGSFFHNYEVEMEADEARNIVAELILTQKRDRLAQ